MRKRDRGSLCCLVQCCFRSFCLWARFHLLGAFFCKLFRRFLDSRSVVQQQRNVGLCTGRLKRFQFAESSRGWSFPLKLDDTKMCACSRLLSQVTFAVVDVVFTRCPQSSFPSVLVAASLSSRRSPSDTRRETLYRHVWSMLTRVID